MKTITKEQYRANSSRAVGHMQDDIEYMETLNGRTKRVPNPETLSSPHLTAHQFELLSNQIRLRDELITSYKKSIAAYAEQGIHAAGEQP